jgi:hypothetical protein
MIGFCLNDHDESRSILYVVIEEPNLTRMTNGDPITLPTQEYGSVMSNVLYPLNLGIVICYEPDKTLLRALVECGDLRMFVDHLTRNLSLDEDDRLGAIIVAMRQKRTAQA